MVSIVELDSQRDILLERIKILKQEILDREPTLDDILRFVRENHPGKQDQYLFEQQLRQAQNELTDVTDRYEKAME